MKLLVPASSGKGEQSTGEPQHYSAFDWEAITPQKRNRAFKDIARPGSNVHFQFTGDEGRQLRNLGAFNAGELGGYAADLLGVSTRTIVDADKDTMIELSGQFRQDRSHPLANGTVVGTIRPSQLN